MKKLLLLILPLLFLLAPSSAFAAIAFDAATLAAAGTGTSYTFSHTVTGSNPALVVGVWIDSNMGDAVTGVTYNGVAMTRQQMQICINTVQRIYLYSLLNPSTGANNVVISVSPSVSNIFAGAASYTGVQGIFSGPIPVTGTSVTPNVSVTTTVDNSWIVGFERGDDTLSSGTNGVRRTASQSFGMFDNNGAITPAQTLNVALSQPSASNWAIIGVAMAPTAAATPARFDFGKWFGF